ncbi:MAG: Hsp33 family molecular chaperone HslO [Wenzhouxiangellaceae bacterium]
MAEFELSEDLLTGDHLQRMLLERHNCRCVAVRLDQTVREVLARAHYPEAIAQLLAEALVLAALCSSGIKFSGRISLQLRGSGALRLLLADCTADGGLRGLARFDPHVLLGGTGFRELTDGGVLALMVEAGPGGRPWQGIVPIVGDTLADAVSAYFGQSEQLPTTIRVSVGREHAAGVLVQRLPGSNAPDDEWARIVDRVTHFDSSWMRGADAPRLLEYLFGTEDRRVFEPRGLRFECSCSRQKVERVLKSLGREELHSILQEQGEIRVDCEFCAERYRFGADEIDKLALAPESGGQGESGQPH